MGREKFAGSLFFMSFVPDHGMKPILCATHGRYIYIMTGYLCRSVNSALAVQRNTPICAGLRGLPTCILRSLLRCAAFRHAKPPVLQ
jgi:hypothetical protein